MNLTCIDIELPQSNYIRAIHNKKRKMLSMPNQVDTITRKQKANKKIKSILRLKTLQQVLCALPNKVRYSIVFNNMKMTALCLKETCLNFAFDILLITEYEEIKCLLKPRLIYDELVFILTIIALCHTFHDRGRDSHLPGPST